MFHNKKNTLIAAAIAGIAGAMIAISLFGKPVYRIGALDIRFSAAPSLKGETKVFIPPLGEIRAKTHSSPVMLQATVEQASVDELRSILISRPDGQSLIKNMTRQARGAAIDFGIRLIMLGFLGGAALALVAANERRFKPVITGAFTGALLTTAVLGLALTTYNTSAFRKPKMTNALKATPWIMQLMKEGVVGLGEMDNRVRSAAKNIYRIQNTISGLVSTGDVNESMRVLAISDLHNNTIAMSYADDLARLFDVSMILNAGDLTDLGTHFESSVAKQVAEFDRPHIFVTGNHDSVETVAALRQLKNTQMPNEHVVTVAGVRILGQHNPASREPGVRRLLSTPAQTSQAVRSLNNALADLSSSPDILLVHEPDVAGHFMGKIPIVVSGHDHIMDARSVKGTAWIRPGTTGASGIRYLSQKSSKAITAAVIYISSPPRPKAVAVDLIKLNAVSGDFSITRKKL